MKPQHPARFYRRHLKAPTFLSLFLHVMLSFSSCYLRVPAALSHRGHIISGSLGASCFPVFLFSGVVTKSIRSLKVRRGYEQRPPLLLHFDSPSSTLLSSSPLLLSSPPHTPLHHLAFPACHRSSPSPTRSLQEDLRGPDEIALLCGTIKQPDVFFMSLVKARRQPASRLVKV